VTTENEQRVGEFITLNKALLDQWGAKVLAATASFDDGTLTADQLAALWAAGTNLAVKGCALTLQTLLDMAPAPPKKETFTGPNGQGWPLPTGADPAKPHKLEMSGPLVGVDSVSKIPVENVTILPAEMFPPETTFRLEVTTVGHKAIVYVGSVLAWEDGSPLPEKTDVTIALGDASEPPP
jgi:hypothetical protein